MARGRWVVLHADGLRPGMLSAREAPQFTSSCSPFYKWGHWGWTRKHRPKVHELVSIRGINTAQGLKIPRSFQNLPQSPLTGNRELTPQPESAWTCHICDSPSSGLSKHRFADKAGNLDGSDHCLRGCGVLYTQLWQYSQSLSSEEARSLLSTHFKAVKVT